MHTRQTANLSHPRDSRDYSDGIFIVMDALRALHCRVMRKSLVSGTHEKSRADAPAQSNLRAKSFEIQ